VTDAGLASSRVVDAQPVDASPLADGDAEADDPRDADTGDASPPALEAPESDMPVGAHIAARLDLAAIRASTLAGPVRRALAASSDWEAIVGGSGISPLDDLERMLLASPNLQRSRWVVAGEHRLNREAIDGAVGRLAAERGEEAAWAVSSGVPVSPWLNRGPTTRQIALLSERHFAITRPADLAALLALSASSVGDDADRVRGVSRMTAVPRGTLMTLEAHGVRRLFRTRSLEAGAEHLPSRATVHIAQATPGRLRVYGALHFDNAEQAARATSFWERQRARLASHLLVTALGFGESLRSLTMELRGSELRFETHLQESQVGALLTYASGLMRQRRRAAAAPPAPASRPTPASQPAPPSPSMSTTE
jgi:hypothetical protein